MAPDPKKGKTQEKRVFHLFRTPAIDGPMENVFLRKLEGIAGIPKINGMTSEYCFNIEMENRQLSDKERITLWWLLSETFEKEKFGETSFLGSGNDKYNVEVAPRLSFTTAWSSNAVSICEGCGLGCISRIERSTRYQFDFGGAKLSDEAKEALNGQLHDRMTEFIAEESIKSFEPDWENASKGTQWVPVMEKGKEALKEISDNLGLAFDDWDLDFYTKLFKEKLKRDPSDVECFDLAQSNSEHSRHWFFGGKMVIDGKEKENTLFQMVKGTNPACSKTNPQKNNSVIAFHDNSSAIQGFKARPCLPNTESLEEGKEDQPASYKVKEIELHGILTCETHNFPCGVAPFPGAATGTGGRIRDVQSTGRGAHVVAGTSSYCVGNLQIPGYELPWEDKSFEYPSNLASPLRIEIEASNGASHYGNCYGEPVISGYTRSFGMRLPNGERREWIKPIMMSAGVGLLDSKHVDKGTPEKGMIVVKIGGPAYKIGIGGGAASSRVQDGKTSELDFNAVQRGDPEMEQKLNRAIRACIELGSKNPIISIHDQGAGGSGNVLKEISEPAGAELYVRRMPTGDETMSALELWISEFQENNALLIHEKHQDLFKRICERENVPFAFVGHITGTGVVKVIDDKDQSVPVNLHLDDVLGKMPQKTFTSETMPSKLEPLKVPEDLTFETALDKVFRLLQIGSKRFLTTKVDRSVTGLIAQQQCVGPLHTPLADVGVIAQSHFPDENGIFTGVASAIGEQPIKGLVCPKAMARMAVAESLTNLVSAKVTSLSDVKCSANWMWAAKLEGEGAAMYDACEAMCNVMNEIGMSVDGGKDSLSMAAKAGDEIVKCPGQLCISVYAMCPDVTLTLTPDFKPFQEASDILHIKVGNKHRLGGSAFAQVHKQIGDTVPDLDDPKALVNAFNAVQDLISKRLLAACHDVSDGGLATCVFEMAFAGNVGFHLDVTNEAELLPYWFSEEVGIVVQVVPGKLDAVTEILSSAKVDFDNIGKIAMDKSVVIQYSGKDLLNEKSMVAWRDVWEATSFELDKLQANPTCVEQESSGLKSRVDPPYKFSFPIPKEAPSGPSQDDAGKVPRVAILREEGSNGDREMASAFVAAGFDAWDVAVADLRMGKITLNDFQGIIFVGGFSYADVLDSAKGWAAGIRFNEKVWNEFQAFYKRKDTFSLGVCNGCQLMALLGWIPGNETVYDQASHDVVWEKQPRFIHNASGRYESRFATVQVQQDNKAMMFKGMEGSVLGVWVAHGEGRVHFPDSAIKDQVVANGQAPLRYVDDEAKVTEAYPFNPNGSVEGITALCSPDGRHLALMPHPERCHRMWQWPWKPQDWESPSDQQSPWMKMFHNAFEWASQHN